MLSTNLLIKLIKDTCNHELQTIKLSQVRHNLINLSKFYLVDTISYNILLDKLNDLSDDIVNHHLHIDELSAKVLPDDVNGTNDNDDTNTTLADIIGENKNKSDKNNNNI